MDNKKEKFARAFQMNRDITQLKDNIRTDNARKLEIAKEQKELTSTIKENQNKLFEMLDEFNDEMKKIQE